MHSEVDQPDPIGSLPTEYQIELDDIAFTFYLTVCVCGEHAKVYVPLPVPIDEAFDAILYVTAKAGWLPPDDVDEATTVILTDGVTTGVEVMMVRRSVRTSWGRKCSFTFDPHNPSNLTAFGGNL